MLNNEVLEALETRRSIRAYKPFQITDDELQAVLRAGTFAPTAHGQQSPFIVAVQNVAMCDQLRRMNAEVMGVTTDPYYGAPTIVLVFVPEDNRNGVQDGSCVLQNMMLAAHSVGLGSCWINREAEMFATDEGKGLMKRMGLPDGLRGVGALALGYAASAPAAPKPRKEDYARIIR